MVHHHRHPGRHRKHAHGHKQPQPRHGGVSPYRKCRKFIAPVGFVVLILLFYYAPKEKTTPFIGGSGLVQDVVNSFTFSNLFDVLFLVILLVTIWFAYRSWLLKLEFIRKKKRLVKKIIIALMILVVLLQIKFSSFLGGLADWGLFIVLIYFTLALFWFLLKTIDRLNLASDLNCWILRIVGGILILFGFLLLLGSFVATAVLLFFSQSNLVSNNIMWVISICVLLLGGFCEFRSTRRFPMVKIW
ncbi:MAG TPA: hypothetical protein HA222_05435 [Candidatus Diapherotrites archaeon]|uniref:Uncharacterized protein n=1 Tax=Candidatus Iainarchaeum sp. TaxID=3101447 RepID=A0A7J4JWF6_9ARCH|nr:hypothetical protein [Candidatus Diapherotrites archaeon]